MTIQPHGDGSPHWTALVDTLVRVYARSIYMESWIPWLRWLATACVILVIIIVVHVGRHLSGTVYI